MSYMRKIAYASFNPREASAIDIFQMPCCHIAGMNTIISCFANVVPIACDMLYAKQMTKGFPKKSDLEDVAIVQFVLENPVAQGVFIIFL